MKKKMSPGMMKKAKKMAEKMKGEPGIENPHALARYVVKKKGKKRK